MANEAHYGDIGCVLTVTIKDSGSVVDISSATTKQIKLIKPSGETVTKTATFTTDGTDGKLQYTTVADDLDEVGIWRLQPYLVMSGWTGHAEQGNFEVYESLT